MKRFFHLTKNEELFVKESLEVISIHFPSINSELESFIESISNFEDKILAGQKVVNFVFQKRYPIIYSKLKFINKIKHKLKNYGIKIFFDKYLENEPTVMLAGGKKINFKDLQTLNLDEDVKRLVEEVVNFFKFKEI